MRRCDFIPDTVWVDHDDGFMRPLRRADDPERWLALCASSGPIITQVDDGEFPDEGIFPTSSSSAPSIMATMLDELELAEGMDILEVGTGTGYNAALLAERVGAERVTSVEVDPMIADHARAALRRTGVSATVVTGDGVLGYPDHAPYDRLIVTAAARHIPYAWVEQTRPGGRIVVPCAGPLYGGHALVTLTVRPDGTAVGRFGALTSFMPLRGQRPQAVSWSHGDYDETATRYDAREPFDGDDLDCAFGVGTRLPGCAPGHTIDDDGVETLRLSHHASGSWAAFTPAERRVRQHGPRRLWDELEAAYAWWTGAGRPEHTRFGLTVTRDGQRVWLDSEDRPVHPDVRPVG